MKERILELLVKSKLTTINEMDKIKVYLDELEVSDIKLNMLEAYGVDNWPGYEMAMHEYYGSYEEE